MWQINIYDHVQLPVRLRRVHARARDTNVRTYVRAAPSRRTRGTDEPRVHHAGRGTAVKKTIGSFATTDDAV